MHLLILGLILVVGILVYYIMTTSPGSGKSSDGKKSKIKRRSDDESESHVPDDLRKEGNVVFLPTAGSDTSENDENTGFEFADHESAGSEPADADSTGSEPVDPDDNA